MCGSEKGAYRWKRFADPLSSIEWLMAQTGLGPTSSLSHARGVAHCVVQKGFVLTLHVY